ncbi:MAG: SGNH/GDSL hydrolase family protein [Chloroflexi bacterium]|nr:SGNH/GDSL hydrolase family protein [Chloroflexota bacterium]
MLIPPRSKLLFIGDSITDCDRERPVGEGGGLGNGYVSLVNALLHATRPQDAVRILNLGVSGNTVRDLEARWQRDVLAHKPDWLAIMIGINDVWRQFDSPMQSELSVALEEYRATLERLIQSARPALHGLILMTPYFIEPNRGDPLRAMMDQYGEAAGQLAAHYNAVCVDTQAAFDAYLQFEHPMTLAWDRIHPNLTGHMLLARAFLDAVGYSWNQK